VQSLRPAQAFFLLRVGHIGRERESVEHAAQSAARSSQARPRPGLAMFPHHVWMARVVPTPFPVLSIFVSCTSLFSVSSSFVGRLEQNLCCWLRWSISLFNRSLLT